MFISSATVSNFRVFKSAFTLGDEHIAIPDGTNEGSGLTVIVGENGVGKSSILEAMSIPLVSYKADAVSMVDFTNIKEAIDITLSSSNPFSVKKTIRGDFQASGFKYTAKVRTQNSAQYAVGTIVSDTYFIPADGESGAPADGSPDLRTAVNNPFAGPRFKENDYVFIDKNRVKTLETGTYSQTRFDRLLDNLNFQYLKAYDNEPLDLHTVVNDAINADDVTVTNESLNEAFAYFKVITGYEVQLGIVDNHQPYKKAFLGFKDLDHSQIPIERIGSGYQMFLALICQHKISANSEKKLIIFIDEVELNLHPRLQKSLVDLLLEISKDSQVIITSHSPELLKDLQKNKHHKINALVREGDGITINPIEKFVLPMPTVSETNYVAFGLASMEYFIELYNHFGEINEQDSVAGIDQAIGAPDDEKIDWQREDGSTQRLSKYSCIRNKFHHPANRRNDSIIDISYSAVDEAIQFLREKIQNE
ncbi:MAG: AAA family ATPase [Candidatus Woesebacteria bacterium]|jgi:ABC-type transport system involved in cytochrome c biogenesis ATPase subunit